MQPQPDRLRTAIFWGGFITAVSLALKGLLELRTGTGWQLLLIAAAIFAALAVRRFLFRD
jgi:hypothetical protein